VQRDWVYVVCRYATSSSYAEEAWTPRDPDPKDPMETAYWVRVDRAHKEKWLAMHGGARDELLKTAAQWLARESKSGSATMGCFEDWGTWPEEPPILSGKFKGQTPRGAGVIAVHQPQSANRLVCLTEKSSGMLSFPKGGRDGNTVKDGALREWREETMRYSGKEAEYESVAPLRFRPDAKGSYLDEASIGVRYLLAEFVQAHSVQHAADDASVPRLLNHELTQEATSNAPTSGARGYAAGGLPLDHPQRRRYQKP